MINSEQSLIFPSDIDEPNLIMFWEVIHFIIGVSLMPLGFITKDLVVLLLTTGLSIFVLRYFKRQLGNSKRNYLAHTVYSYGYPTDDFLRKYPSSYKNFSGR